MLLPVVGRFYRMGTSIKVNKISVYHRIVCVRYVGSGLGIALRSYGSEHPKTRPNRIIPGHNK